MLDLIIPVYKNREGLKRTLMSIGTSAKDQLIITIVNDCSGEDYTDVIDFFKSFFTFQYFTLPTNSGPGIARQYGIDHTHEDLITFIDCGDTFVSPDMVSSMIRFTGNYPDVNMFSWEHLEELGPNQLQRVSSIHNRMHGKVYRRNFLNKYNIRFSTDSPRANEDIGFNRACRLINAQLTDQDHKSHICQVEEPAVLWKSDGPSITRENNGAFYFKQQNMGLALNSIHAYNTVKAAGVEEKIIVPDVYDIASHMYMFFIATRARRPEFLQEAWDGTRLYLQTVYNKYADYDHTLFKNVFYQILSNFLSNTEDPIRDKLIPIDIKKFIKDVNESETVLPEYLD